MPDEFPDWDSIVDKHAERVFRIAFRILGAVHDAEDVSQNVFAEALKIHRGGSVRSWTGLLVRLSTLRSIDTLRSRRTHSPVAEHDHVSNVEPSDEAVGRELATWLRRASAELPEQQAAVFSLAHYEQLERNEIAAILAISPEAVSTSLYKARKTLQSQISVLDGGSK